MSAEPKILVVDDEDRIRRLVRMYLEKEDFIVEEAENGKKALEMALNTDYEVILLDIMMPEMDGIEMTIELRKEQDTTIILPTAMGEESNRVQVFEIGSDDYIVKPHSPREVVLRVKAVLSRVASGHYNDTEKPTKPLLVFPHLTID